MNQLPALADPLNVDFIGKMTHQYLSRRDLLTEFDLTIIIRFPHNSNYTNKHHSAGV